MAECSLLLLSPHRLSPGGSSFSDSTGHVLRLKDAAGVRSPEAFCNTWLMVDLASLLEVNLIMQKKILSEKDIKTSKHCLLASLSLQLYLLVYLQYCLFVGNIKNMCYYTCRCYQLHTMFQRKLAFFSEEKGVCPARRAFLRRASSRLPRKS